MKQKTNKQNHIDKTRTTSTNTNTHTKQRQTIKHKTYKAKKRVGDGNIDSNKQTKIITQTEHKRHAQTQKHTQNKDIIRKRRINRQTRVGEGSNATEKTNKHNYIDRTRTTITNNAHKTKTKNET